MTSQRSKWPKPFRTRLTLPQKFRIAILLRYFEELSYEEMAKVLNCSMGTVASRLSRGHRILATKLTPLREWFRKAGS